MVFQRFLHWLRQPFPLLNDGPRIWRMALIAFLFVTLFLFFFRPFGMQLDSGEANQWFRICLEYGAVTLVALLTWGWTTRLLPTVFREETWQVWREILSSLGLITLIAMANMVYTHFRYGMPINGRTVWQWQIITWGVGIFPMLYGVFHKQLRLMRRYATEARSLSASIVQPPDTPVVESLPITLQGENQGERLLLTADQLYYLAAADNYVQVFYREKEQFRNRMLRGTLKKMEDALVSHPQFFRCHRTYLVNLDKVSTVSGNAQGYRLHLFEVEETVPVSRNLNEVVQQRFGAVS